MSDIFDTNETNPTFIFVDGSYYNFYRYFALMQWWKKSHSNEVLEDPYENTEFLEKFKKTHLENLRQISKKLNLPKDILPILIVGKDCKRENIWRMKHFSKYKANRNNTKENGFMGASFFKMVYEEKLFEKGGARFILKHPQLEADDCIALSVKYLLNKYSQMNTECQIYIITSDKDYLQLNAPNVHLYNLAYKNIAEKSSIGNPKKDLQLKIIMGDSSDNIPSIFPKCGLKTAQKCIDNPDFLQKKILENIEYNEQYKLNQLLINFDNIPIELQKEFNIVIYTP
jgi:5'-3' exonuclease